MREKFKSIMENDQLFYAGVVLLVAISSFGLGRSSVSQVPGGGEAAVVISSVGDTKSLVSEKIVPVTEKAQTTFLSENTAVVASKSGSKYHLPTCPGAAQIKPENRLSFDSIAAAQAAGYTSAANCPGLK